MLHDALSSGQRLDRRGTARQPLDAELVIIWHHDPNTTIRYRVLDISDGGARILSTTPLMAGMNGTAVKLLPKGSPVNRPCMVSWSASNEQGTHEVGLTFG